MKVGSLVECINDDLSKNDPRVHQFITAYVVKGEIYTVREIQINPVDSVPGLLLEEIVNHVNTYYNLEQAWCIKRFREIQPPMDLSELMEETQLATA